MTPTRVEILERERATARPAAIAAILMPPLFIASLYLEGSSAALGEILPSEQYRALHADAGKLLAAYVLRGVALALACVPLLYLFRAAQTRSERISSAMIGFVFIGPLLYGISLILTNVAQGQIASDFVARAAAGGDVYSLLQDIGADSTLATVGSSLFLPATLGLVVALVYTCLQAQRVGLLTRFFGSLGMALGVLLVLIQPRFSLLVLAIWFGWFGFMILGRTPRGRPPAWATGEAVPWPAPGQQSPSEPQDAAAPDVPPGDADDGGSAKDQAARRERAKKRKRKRRR